MKRMIIFISFIFSVSLFAQQPPNTIWEPIAPTDLPLPNYLEAVIDDSNNMEIIRISDTLAFNVPEGAGELLHGYSKTQAWNADMSKLFVGFTNVLQANDYSLYRNINFPDGYFNDGRWANTNPDIRYFCWEEGFYKINIETDEVILLESFPNYITATIGPWEGNISEDDKYVVITNEAGNKASLYDIQLDLIISSKEFEEGVTFDWTSITPWGNYIVVSNNSTGSTEIYDLNFNFIRILSPTQQHADFAIDTSGNEVLVEVIPLIMTQLETGEVTDLISNATYCGWPDSNPSIPGHISGRNFNLPGWALVSTYTEECPNGNGYYFATDMFAVKLDGSGTIKHYGYSRSSFLTYNKNSFASFSPDGSQVVFNSDWDFEQEDDGITFAYVTKYIEPLSIIESNTKPTFIIYPNPITKIAALETNKSVICSIYDINGKRILTKMLPKGKSFISFSNFESGIYFIKLPSGQTKRIIKK